jgi:pyrroloquinoline quinone (PQQ) biosynthesis protein C
MLEVTNENFARLLRGLTIAVGNRRNRILLYQFLAAEIRALHCSYGVGDDESYKRALGLLENCERYTLRSLVRRSAKHHAEITVDHAKRVFLRALEKLDSSQGHNPTVQAIIMYFLKEEPLEANSQWAEGFRQHLA